VQVIVVVGDVIALANEPELEVVTVIVIVDGVLRVRVVVDLWNTLGILHNTVVKSVPQVVMLRTETIRTGLVYLAGNLGDGS
jgi:hypothetical protein